jgi:predicted peptidase
MDSLFTPGRSRQLLVVLAAVGAGLVGCGPNRPVARPLVALASSSRQTLHSADATSAPNGFLEYLPPDYDGSTPAPLLVFLHGIGQAGNGVGANLLGVAALGLPHLIATNAWPADRPFIVLSPQYGTPTFDLNPGGGCPSSASIDAFLSWAVGNYAVDRKRIYLTGLSCGAIGGWDYLAVHGGELVAAAVLIAGNPGVPTTTGSAWQRAGCRLGGAAIWSVHGDADDTVPFAPDRDTLAKLVDCPAPPRRDARFTAVTGKGHDVWTETYDLTGGHGDIYAWLLADAKP